MVLKELIFNNFFSGRGWWESFLTIPTLGGCGGLERSFSFLTIPTLGGCGGLERTDLLVSILGGCGCLDRTHF